MRGPLQMETMMQGDEHQGDRWFKEAMHQANSECSKGSSTGPASPSPTCATSAKPWNRRRRSDGSVRRKISRRRRSSSLHPIRNGSPAKHYSSREVFVRHLQKTASTARKEN